MLPPAAHDRLCSKKPVWFNFIKTRRGNKSTLPLRMWIALMKGFRQSGTLSFKAIEASCEWMICTRPLAPATAKKEPPFREANCWWHSSSTTTARAYFRLNDESYNLSPPAGFNTASWFVDSNHRAPHLRLRCQREWIKIQHICGDYQAYMFWSSRQSLSSSRTEESRILKGSKENQSLKYIVSIKNREKNAVPKRTHILAVWEKPTNTLDPLFVNDTKSGIIYAVLIADSSTGSSFPGHTHDR